MQILLQFFLLLLLSFSHIIIVVNLVSDNSTHPSHIIDSSQSTSSMTIAPALLTSSIHHSQPRQLSPHPSPCSCHHHSQPCHHYHRQFCHHQLRRSYPPPTPLPSFIITDSSRLSDPGLNSPSASTALSSPRTAADYVSPVWTHRQHPPLFHHHGQQQTEWPRSELTVSNHLSFITTDSSRLSEPGLNSPSASTSLSSPRTAADYVTPVWTHRQHPPRWSCPVARPPWGSVPATSSLCPVLWWWWCRHHPCRTARTPPWTLQGRRIVVRIRTHSKPFLQGEEVDRFFIPG